MAAVAGWYPSNYLELCGADDDVDDRTTTPGTTTIPTPALYADTPSPRTTRSFHNTPDGVGTLIRAKYDYRAAKTDELPFAAGDRLLLVDRTPTEGSHWWRAASHTAEGLVPRAYFIVEDGGGEGDDERCDSSTSLGGSSDPAVGGAKPFAGKDWYFGRIPRSQCDSLLNKHGREGDFIVRDSETNVSGCRES